MLNYGALIAGNEVPSHDASSKKESKYMLKDVHILV